MKRMLPNLSTLSIGAYPENEGNASNILGCIMHQFISHGEDETIHTHPLLQFCMTKFTADVKVEKLIAWLYILMGQGDDGLNEVPLLSAVVDFYNLYCARVLQLNTILLKDVQKDILSIFTESEHFYKDEEALLIKTAVEDIAWPILIECFPFDSKDWDAMIFFCKNCFVNIVKVKGKLSDSQIIASINYAAVLFLNNMGFSWMSELIRLYEANLEANSEAREMLGLETMTVTIASVKQDIVDFIVEATVMTGEEWLFKQKKTIQKMREERLPKTVVKP